MFVTGPNSWDVSGASGCGDRTVGYFGLEDT